MELKRQLHVLDTLLASRRFVCGDQCTIADMVRYGTDLLYGWPVYFILFSVQWLVTPRLAPTLLLPCSYLAPTLLLPCSYRYSYPSLLTPAPTNSCSAYSHPYQQLPYLLTLCLLPPLPISSLLTPTLPITTYLPLPSTTPAKNYQ